MNNKLYIFLLLGFFFSITKVSAQFYNSFTAPYIFEDETSAIELNDGLVFGFTINTNNKNFHKNILLIKTNTAGDILWSKRFDADSGVSIKLNQMMRTADNKILIAGETGGDNKPNTVRFLIKINASGKVLWTKKYNTDNSYGSGGLVQLKDSSFVFSFAAKQFSPAIMQVDKNGNVLQAMRITNRQFDRVQSITSKGNTADIIVGNSTVANIDFITSAIQSQRQYNTSNQFTALISSRCKNGDIIYLAGRTYGGLLSGTSRIFRTTANGDLIWAKNIEAKKDLSGSAFSIFDIVVQNYIHEDINGNIVAEAQDESLHNILIVFNAAGKYLYHHFLTTPYNFFTEAADGRYLQTSTAFSNSSQLSLIADRFIKRKSSCDSSIFVTVTKGTDSATTLDKMIFKPIVISSSAMNVTAFRIDINTKTYCDLLSQNKIDIAPAEMIVKIFPNPAADKIIVQTDKEIPFSIYNWNGSLMMNSLTNRSTNISALVPGLYTVVIKNNDGLITKAFIKH